MHKRARMYPHILRHSHIQRAPGYLYRHVHTVSTYIQAHTYTYMHAHARTHMGTYQDAHTQSPRLDDAEPGEGSLSS